VELEEARVLAAIARGKIGSIAVMVDADDESVDCVAVRVRPDLLQLHGKETPERVAAIKKRAGLPVMKAISVSDASDTRGAATYLGVADYILFDAKATPDAMRPGGNGVPFDWRTLAGLKSPFALSGGLTPTNVGEAISLTGASLVDVSSGVERAPGEKDSELVREFIHAAKADTAQARTKAS
jgi:phosphoribosylanthranilate isomerase